MFASLALPNARRSRIWFEVDRGTEYSKQIRGKLLDYCKAFESADDAWPDFLLARDEAGNVLFDDEQYEVQGQFTQITREPRRMFPRILWVALNDLRAEQLRRLISYLGTDERRRLFHVLRDDDRTTMLILSYSQIVVQVVVD